MSAIRQTLKFAALSLAALALLTYPADWAVWKARGSQMDSVDVTRFVVASLKGNKEEYYPDGDATIPCSQSLFPQGGGNPCWYVQRHKVVFER